MPQKPPDLDASGRAVSGAPPDLDDNGEPLNALGLSGPPQSKEKAPWNANDSHNASEVLKQFLGLGGALVGSTLGPAGTIAGNSIGRTIGHIPEALASRSTGHPNDSSFAGDAALGAMEGGVAELAPAGLGLGAKWGGKGLRIIGDAATKWTGGSRLGGPVRAAMAHASGGGIEGDLAAMALPPAMSATGRGLERAGEAIGTKTLSQRTQPAMDSLMGRGESADSSLEQQFESVFGKLPNDDQMLAEIASRKAGRSPRNRP